MRLPRPSGLGSGDQWQLNESHLTWCMVNALGGFAIVAWLRPKNVGNESLWIAVVERKPGGLNLDHDAVAGEEDVICIGKREAIKERLVGRNGLWRFKTLAIAAAEDVRRNHQLIAAHGRLAGHLGGIDVDQLDHPVEIPAAAGSPPSSNGLP